MASQEALDRAAVIAALVAYRTRLKARGEIFKAAVVDQCLDIVRRF
jgi:hypothetical protein